VEHILSSGPQAKRVRELKGLAERLSNPFDLGKPLEIATKKRMETFFGYNLEDVRIHEGSRAEEASRRLGARAFIFREHIFGSRQNLDTEKREGLGLLAHELTHVIQQTRPHQQPQDQAANLEDRPVSARSLEGDSDAKTAFCAPPQSPPTSVTQQQREAQAQVNEQVVQRAFSDNEPRSPSQVNLGEVADKVYRLMQSDLILERERATRVGG